jgi:nonribosomal peptide synthetase DhbF
MKDLNIAAPAGFSVFPLSSAQLRLWLAEQIHSGGGRYAIRLALRLRGGLDVPALLESVQAMIARHEALRTVFPARSGQPVQLILPRLVVDIPLSDAAGQDERQRLEFAELRARMIADEPFDLARGPLLRAELIRLGPADYLLAVALHHIVADRWSLGILMRELSACYHARVTGEPAELPALALGYADYAAWEQQYLTGAEADQLTEFWRGYLADAPPPFALPPERAAAPSREAGATTAHLTLDPAAAEGVAVLARDNRVSPYAVLLGAFTLVMSRHTGLTDIVVASAVATRTAQTETVVGCFVNELPVRTSVSGDPTFRELLRRVAASLGRVLEHRDLPFERIVAELGRRRDGSQNPFTKVGFLLQNAPLPQLSLQDLDVAPVLVPAPESQADLEFQLWTQGNGYAGTVQYASGQFSSARIGRLIAQLSSALVAARMNPNRPVSELDILTPDERAQLLGGLAGAGREPATVRCPHRQVEAQARLRPDAVAVTDLQTGACMRYAELNARASQLARHLRRLGVGPDTPVGICLPRGCDLIVAMLGVAKAGGAYVALDPAYPRLYRSFLIEDSGAGIVIASQAEELTLPGRRIVDPADAGQESSADIELDIHPDSLAYLLYTSGSTGTPKGVCIPHRALASRTAAFIRSMELQPGDRVLQFNSINFDASVHEIMPCLAAGATLALRSEIMTDPAALTAGLARSQVTVLAVPTAYWHLWVDSLLTAGEEPSHQLRLVFIGGEQPDWRRVAAWHQLSGGVRLGNAYGPTEATVAALTADLTAGTGSEPTPVPIGRPLAGTDIYLLSSDLTLVPLGAVGELYVGGSGLARGYHGRPGASAARFIPHAFGSRPGERLYATGDLARYLPDGSVEYVGRVDDQVKIRGFRIEPGEITPVLRAHPGVADAAVVPRRDSSGTMRLVAYYVPADAAPSSLELRAHLRGQLPVHMLPDSFVPVDRLPLLRTGKLDRAALPAPGVMVPEPGPQYAAPRSATEQAIAGLWSELLGTATPGIHDDFIESGGHSLLATQLAARLRDRFQVDVRVSMIFEAPTVAGQAAEIERLATAAGRSVLPEIRPAERTTRSPLSYSQQRLWFFDQLERDQTVYTTTMAARLSGPLDLAALRTALTGVAARHEALRTTYGIADGQPIQHVHPPGELPATLVDLTGTPPQAVRPRLDELTSELAAHRFDLSTDYPIRVLLVRLAADSHVLQIAVHHVAIDGWSVRILVDDLLRLYQHARGTAAGRLPAPALQPADHALWERTPAVQQHYDAQLAYWREQLAGNLPVLALPTDRTRPAVPSYRAGRCSTTIGPDVTGRLRDLAMHSGASIFMIMLSAFNVLLGRLGQTDDVILGAPVAGRIRPELESVVGCFINTVALRTDLGGDLSVADLIGRVRKIALDAFDHQDVPFDRVVEALQPDREAGHEPLVKILFMVRNEPPPALPSGDLTVTPLDIELQAAQYELSCVVAEAAESLTITFEYSADVFELATVQELLATYAVLVSALPGDCGRRVRALPMLDAARTRRQLVDWNATARGIPAQPDLSSLVWAQAARTPDAVAVEDSGGRLSYRELAADASTLAVVLREAGAGPERVVGIYLRPSIQLAVAILAVLRAGAAFLPLDPDLPADRLRLMAADAAAQLLITDPSLERAAAAIAGDAEVLVLGATPPPHAEPSWPAPAARSLACIFYTSGSTGTPKGVMFEHRSLVNYTLAMIDEFELEPGDRLLQLASIGFDVLAEELFPVLASGGAVVFAPSRLLAEGGDLGSLIDEAGITVVEPATRYWHEWVRRLTAAGRKPPACLRLVALGGDRIMPERAADWQAFGIGLINVYGLTETCVTSAVYRPSAAADRIRSAREIPIGRPVANTSMYVLDDTGRPMPVGVPGELYVGGLGVNRGFLGRPAQTAERYVPDPFATAAGAVLYRTGDLACYRDGGDIQLLGRADRQVKVRGYRIELGEVEAVLADHPAVLQAVAVVDHADGHGRLIGYVATGGPDSGLDDVGLRDQLRRRLPAYMVPAAIVVIPDMPMNANGKIARSRLPAPTRDSVLAEAQFVAPRTPVEAELAEICAAVLAIDEVGMDDNFFDLGGHSLLAIELIASINAQFRADVALRDVFEAQTVAELALRIVQRQAESVDSAELAELMAEIEAGFTGDPGD